MKRNRTYNCQFFFVCLFLLLFFFPPRQVFSVALESVLKLALVDQAGLTHRATPASASWVLGLKAWATTAQPHCWFLYGSNLGISLWPSGYPGMCTISLPKEKSHQMTHRRTLTYFSERLDIARWVLACMSLWRHWTGVGHLLNKASFLLPQNQGVDLTIHAGKLLPG